MGMLVMLLCMVGLAYDQGWFDWSDSSTNVESYEVGVNQTIDQEKTKADAASGARMATEPAATPT